MFKIAMWGLSGLIMLFSACGMKGPPKPPSQDEPPVVNDLSYEIEKESVKLSWTIPQKGGKRPSRMVGFKIFRFKQTFKEAECETCPPQFEEIWDLPIVDKREGEVPQDKMFLTDSLESGYRYVYKVRVYLNNGVMGSDSNVVDFRFEKKDF